METIAINGIPKCRYCGISIPQWLINEKREEGIEPRYCPECEQESEYLGIDLETGEPLD